MNPSSVLVGIASFMGGLLLISRVGEWLTLLAVSRKHTTPLDGKPRLIFIPAALHSGPWLLALAAFSGYYAVAHAEQPYVWSAGAGLGISLIVGGGSVALARWRNRHPIEPKPLTPERLSRIKQRFFWGSSCFFGLGLAATFGIWFASGFYGTLLVGVTAFLIGFGIGWAWSFVMWQWYSAALQEIEIARMARQRHESQP